MRLAAPNDLVLLISPDRKRFVVRLIPGDDFHTHRGVVKHDDILGHPTSITVESHNGAKFKVMRPTMEELLKALPRNSQIVYPKDIGYILMKLSIMPGTTIVEAGCGSGILTSALARYVTPGGHVYSYEVRPDMIEMASENVKKLGLEESVTFHQRSIEAGFEQTGVDALFLDLREPWHYLTQASDALADGGFFGSIVPTNNQVVHLVRHLHRGPFTDIEVCELMLRQYRPIPERIRPLDRLTAHTGYLLFARKDPAAVKPNEDRIDAEGLLVDEGVAPEGGVLNDAADDVADGPAKPYDPNDYIMG